MKTVFLSGFVTQVIRSLYKEKAFGVQNLINHCNPGLLLLNLIASFLVWPFSVKVSMSTLSYVFYVQGLMVLREGCYMETHCIIQSNKFCWFWWSIIFHMRSHIDSITRETDLISPEEQYFFILLTVSILSFSIFSVKTVNRLNLLKKKERKRGKTEYFLQKLWPLIFFVKSLLYDKAQHYKVIWYLHWVEYSNPRLWIQKLKQSWVFSMKSVRVYKDKTNTLV